MNELLQQNLSSRKPLKYKRVGIFLGIIATLAVTGIAFAVISKIQPSTQTNKKEQEISLKNSNNDNYSAPEKIGIAEEKSLLNTPISTIANNSLDTNYYQNGSNNISKKDELKEQARLAPPRSKNISNININTSSNNLPNIPIPNEADIIKNLGNTMGGANTTTNDNDPNLQNRKEKFAELKKSNYYLDSQIQQARSKFTLNAGSFIPAVMNHGISSDLPGILSATVTQNVYDTTSGQILLIPQGTKLNGRYDSQIAFGQNRIMVIWDRLVFSDGKTFDLGAMAGADQAGKSGFSDKVNNHYGRTFGSAILVSIIGSGMQLSQPKGRSGAGNDAQEVITGNVAQQTGNTAQGVLNKTLNVQPTLEIEAGYTFNVAVNKDMVLDY